jgi:hypothetical protein
LLQARLDVVVRAQRFGLFHVDIGGLRDEHEIARRDRATVDGRAHLDRHVRPRGDAVDVVREVVGGDGQRVQGHACDRHDEDGEHAKAGNQLVLDRNVLQIHLWPFPWMGRNGLAPVVPGHAQPHAVTFAGTGMRDALLFPITARSRRS